MSVADRWIAVASAEAADPDADRRNSCRSSPARNDRRITPGGAATVRGWSGGSGDTRRVGADIRKFRSSIRRRGSLAIDERKTPCC